MIGGRERGHILRCRYRRGKCTVRGGGGGGVTWYYSIGYHLTAKIAEADLAFSIRNSFQDRQVCLNSFVKELGHMPLVHSQEWVSTKRLTAFAKRGNIFAFLSERSFSLPLPLSFSVLVSLLFCYFSRSFTGLFCVNNISSKLHLQVRLDPVLFKDPVSNLRKKYRKMELAK
jgi:hypothetical protein